MDNAILTEKVFKIFKWDLPWVKQNQISLQFILEGNTN